MNVFCVSEFEGGVNDSIFSGNEQQKVYYKMATLHIPKLINLLLTNFHPAIFSSHPFLYKTTVYPELATLSWNRSSVCILKTP